jgi:hypothetical protein
MAECIAIELQPVRARIEIGSYYYVTTGQDDNAAGDIISWSLNKARGQQTSNLRCQLVVDLSSDALEDIEYTDGDFGHKVVVYAGRGLLPDRNLPKLFTGYITSLNTEPYWEEEQKFMLSITAEDTFALMKDKFSRRFKGEDDAFAVITGGKRREGGRMTKLRRVPPGSKGVDFVAAGSSNVSMDHSPLIRTPDPQGLTPKAVVPSSNSSEETSQGQYEFNPPYLWARVGTVQKVQVVDKSTGEPVDPQELENIEGTGCLLCKGYSMDGGNKGMVSGADDFPLSVKYGTQTENPSEKVFEFTCTGDFPSSATFIHPQTAGTCTIHFYPIPPHTHRTMMDGGPAVGTFDVGQL